MQTVLSTNEKVLLHVTMAMFGFLLQLQLFLSIVILNQLQCLRLHWRDNSAESSNLTNGSILSNEEPNKDTYKAGSSTTSSRQPWCSDEKYIILEDKMHVSSQVALQWRTEQLALINLQSHSESRNMAAVHSKSHRDNQDGRFRVKFGREMCDNCQSYVWREETFRMPSLPSSLLPEIGRVV